MLFQSDFFTFTHTFYGWRDNTNNISTTAVRGQPRGAPKATPESRRGRCNTLIPSLTVFANTKGSACGSQLFSTSPLGKSHDTKTIAYFRLSEVDLLSALIYHAVSLLVFQSTKEEKTMFVMCILNKL